MLEEMLEEKKCYKKGRKNQIHREASQIRVMKMTF